MRTLVLFRLMLIASALFVLTALLLRASQFGMPSELLRYKNANSPLAGEWSGLANYFLGLSFLLAFTWAVVALYSFRAFAKESAVTAMLLFSILPIVQGPVIEFGWTVSLEHMALALLAAAFVLARLSPLKEFFPRE